MSAIGNSKALAVIVITRNEADRLGRCLASVAFADEIIVVDSGSSDGTQDIARRAGARVVETADWPGFGPQKQRALACASAAWVLSLDADEWLEPTLADAVKAAVRSPADGNAPAGYILDRLSAFCGQWMRGGSWSPDPVLRLFQRQRARFSDDAVHERVLLDGPTGRLPGRLLHDSIHNLHDALDKLNRYSSGRADDLRRRGKRGGLGAALGHGLWAFCRSYLLRRGFIDGRRGVVLALLDAQATYYRYLKLWLHDMPRAADLPPPD